MEEINSNSCSLHCRNKYGGGCISIRCHFWLLCLLSLPLSLGPLSGAEQTLQTHCLLQSGVYNISSMFPEWPITFFHTNMYI